MTDTTQQQVDAVGDFGTGEAAKAARWISEIDLSERSQSSWLTRCRKIIRRYKDERTSTDDLYSTQRRRFAVLWSNIQVLQPAVYAKPPQAVVLRRFKDSDPLGKVAAEVLERALNYSIDVYDFDWVMKQCRDENLLCGLGQTWIRYVPTFAQTPKDGEGEEVTDNAEQVAADDDDADAEEYLQTEQVICDHVNYADFGTNKARTWDEVRFVWRRVYMAREALKKRFTMQVPGTAKTIGETLPLDWNPERQETSSTNDTNSEQFKKAQIYEVWDLDSRKAYWVSKSYPYSVLDERDDPLGLNDFFPCPRPVLATLGPDSTIPVPDYVFYQDQAEEIDDLTLRIGILTDSLRMVGFYAGQESVNMQNVFKSGNENKLIPVDSWAQFKESGGVRGLMEWVPIDMVVAALTACYESRKQLLDDVYQITGISDIMRGDTDPRETKGAQVLKSQWGSSRVRERQKEVARFARDILRINAEIIAEKFSWQTLRDMTNLDLFTNEEKQQALMQIQAQQQQAQMQAAMAAQQAPQQPMPMAGAPSPSPAPAAPPQPPEIPAELQQKLAQPTWEEVEQFLRSDALRRFRIDVETDSTVEPEAATEKADMVEFVTAIGGIINSSLPAVTAAPPLGELVGAIVKVAARKFHAGRELEDVIDRVMDKIAQLPPPPPEQSGAAPEDPRIAAMQAQIDQMGIAQKEHASQLKAQVDTHKIDTDAAIKREQMASEDKRSDADKAMAWLEAMTQRLHETNEAQADREHDADQADEDRDNAVKVAAAKPKPKVSA